MDGKFCQVIKSMKKKKKKNKIMILKSSEYKRGSVVFVQTKLCSRLIANLESILDLAKMYAVSWDSALLGDG